MQVKTVNTPIQGEDRRQQRIREDRDVATDWVTCGLLTSTIRRLMYSRSYYSVKTLDNLVQEVNHVKWREAGHRKN